MPIRYVIKQGDSVIRLSEVHGLFAVTIWDDPANAELKAKRKDMNELMPGDVVVVPDKTVKQVPAATGKLHVFRRKGIPALYRVRLLDVEAPRANQSYKLTVDGTLYEGTTDENGVLEQYVPASAIAGQLVIGPDELTIELDFGHLDPITEISGVQKRLNNLGYLCGEPDGLLNDDTIIALCDFQIRFGLEETGEADEPTLAKLAELHDSTAAFPAAEES
jgi:N-acetylmuramoyl-L-alanine amidase